VTSSSFFHHAREILSPPKVAPIHFRAWRGGTPYNLCEAPLGEAQRWSPYRSVTTCEGCLGRLR
jgi:hypothetical protein